MSEEQLDREQLKRQYDTLCPKYDRLASNLREALKEFLTLGNLDILDVVFRIKAFDSFLEKIDRKGYKKPFQEMEDICGLRIICPYHSDLDKIGEVIKREFDVSSSVDKADLLEPDRFGYRSHHYIVSVKKNWLEAPNYRGLAGLKAEIQVRTILMHAWADIQGKLAYKTKEDIPDQFRRRLYQISAIFELADELFDRLREERETYVSSLKSTGTSMRPGEDFAGELNLDSLRAFLDIHIPDPDRVRNDEATSLLLTEIVKAGLTFKELTEAFERTKNLLPEVEKEVEASKQAERAKRPGISKRNIPFRWTQVGIARVSLFIANDTYWDQSKSKIPVGRIPIYENWRDILRKEHR